MAGELVSFGVQKLWNLLDQEYEQFAGVEDQVSELKSDLNLLNSFLKDADNKKHTSAMVRNCVEEIKGIICDGEDIIDTFLYKKRFGNTSGIKKRIKGVVCVILDRRKVALDIGGISKKISKVISDMKSFGIQQIIADGEHMQPQQVRQREMRQEFARDNESNFVGLEANVKKLVGYLVEENNVQVVSITGMGGVGKTTIARQVFNHEMVKQKFDGLAWVCVSQEFTRKSVWQTILGNLKPNEEEKKILGMTEPTLQDELYRLLETSNSLIVFDDIWKEEDWDLIKPIFPPKKGWKVLLTSRNENVVVRRDTKYINFKPECLNIEDIWTLFQRIAFPKKDASEFKKVDAEMEDIGKSMVEHCGGLPLAIKVLGGLLAAKYTLHDWKRLSTNIGSHIIGKPSFNRVLSLSFEELPSYLKYCFLSLAYFPEDHRIYVETLSYYWATEEIYEPMHYTRETIRDAGDSYIEELVWRNMVISQRDDTTLRYETCHLHDMMREICLSKAKEENFVQIGSICSPTANSQSAGASRRFVSQNPTTLDVERERKISNVRSLVVVSNGSRYDKWKISSLRFTRLRLLRVLHLAGGEFKGGKLDSSIGKLIHLRYLSLKDAVVSHIPYSLGNLKLLIYLNLMVTGEAIVPNVLMGMQDLRYLALPWFGSGKTKLELSNLVKLETLKNFSTDNSSLEDLRNMVRLRTLYIDLDAETSLETLIYMLMA